LDFAEKRGVSVKKSRPQPEKPKRRKGRPARESSSAVGRQELIEATRRLLREKASSEIGRLDVATKAGVDPALIRYYFGNMNGLMTEVTAQLSRDMHRQIAVAEATAPSPDKKLRNRIGAILEILADTPFLTELIVRQIVYGTKEAARNARREMVTDSLATLQALIQEGTGDGRFRQIDPRMLHIAIIGMCDFFFTGRPVLIELFGREGASAKEYADFVFDLIMDGIRPRTRR
jgi:AcrR family transcriptional regulator